MRGWTVYYQNVYSLLPPFSVLIFSGIHFVCLHFTAVISDQIVCFAFFAVRPHISLLSLYASQSLNISYSCRQRS